MNMQILRYGVIPELSSHSPVQGWIPAHLPRIVILLPGISPTRAPAGQLAWMKFSLITPLLGDDDLWIHFQVSGYLKEFFGNWVFDVKHPQAFCTSTPQPLQQKISSCT